MSKTKKLGFIIIGATVFLFVLLIVTKPKTNKIDIKETIWPIEALVVNKKINKPNLLLYGTVQTPKITTLESSVNADVRSVNTSVGDFVKKYQLLVSLDPKDIRLILQQRKSDLLEINAIINSEQKSYLASLEAIKAEKVLITLKEKSLERHEYLLKKKVGSQESFDIAKQVLTQQKLSMIQRKLLIDNYPHKMQQLQAKKNKIIYQLVMTKRDYKRTRVLAPFAGIVTKVDSAKGNKAKPGQPLISLYDLSNIEMRSFIPLKYLKKILPSLKKHPDLTATCNINDHEVQLKLSKLAGHIEQSRGGIDAFFKFNLPMPKITMGQTTEIWLELPPSNDSIKIPATSLYENNKVYLIKNDRLQSVKVELIGYQFENNNTYMIVKSDKIHTRDQMLLSKLPNIRSNMLVKIIKPKNEQ